MTLLLLLLLLPASQACCPGDLPGRCYDCETGLLQADCHPACSWSCSNPTCDAVCTPVVDAHPVFNMTCEHRTVAECLLVRVDFPSDQCSQHSCPTPETVVANACNDCNYTVVSPVASTWWCTSPSDCPEPVCTLQCEDPSCKTLQTFEEAPTQSAKKRGLSKLESFQIATGVLASALAIVFLFILVMYVRSRDDYMLVWG